MWAVVHAISVIRMSITTHNTAHNAHHQGTKRHRRQVNYIICLWRIQCLFCLVRCSSQPITIESRPIFGQHDVVYSSTKSVACYSLCLILLYSQRNCIKLTSSRTIECVSTYAELFIPLSCYDSRGFCIYVLETMRHRQLQSLQTSEKSMA